jgi:hypothetical protein
MARVRIWRNATLMNDRVGQSEERERIAALSYRARSLRWRLLSTAGLAFHQLCRPALESPKRFNILGLRLARLLHSAVATSWLNSRPLASPRIEASRRLARLAQRLSSLLIDLRYRRGECSRCGGG